MTDYPRYEVYRKAVRDETSDTRGGRKEDIPSYRIPFDSHRSPFPTPRRCDFDSLEDAKEAMKKNAGALDLGLGDYYILKVSEEDVEIAYGDPSKTIDGAER